MKGNLYINGKDAYTTWGMFLTDTAISALMTPPPMKDNVENASRLENGKRVDLSSPKVDERDVTLPFAMTAASKDTFLSNYESLCAELANGSIVLRTKYQPNVYYRLVYTSCTQYSQFVMGLAKFTLKLNEPDPTNRSKTDKNA